MAEQETKRSKRIRYPDEKLENADWPKRTQDVKLSELSDEEKARAEARSKAPV